MIPKPAPLINTYTPKLIHRKKTTEINDWRLPLSYSRDWGIYEKMRSNRYFLFGQPRRYLG